jgi:hypothetical protein
MQMREEVFNLLSQENQPQKLTDFKNRLLGLVRMSRRTMSGFYPMWDRNDSVYRGERTWDEQDRKAKKRNEPEKVYVPMTHSQIQTFVSFATMLLSQRDFFFELGGTGGEDERAAQLGSAVLERDLEYNKFTGVLLPQFFTDVCRFGIGIFKSQWTHETTPVAKQVPDPKWRPVPGLPQTQPPTVTLYQPVTSYLGNKIEVVSPYRWFPDTRLPITRAQYGEFQADENEYSRDELRRMETNKEVAGLEFVPSIPSNAYEDRRSFLLDNQSPNGSDPMISPEDAKHYVLITEVEIKLNPSKVEIDDGVFLDPSIDAEMVFCVWIGNDSRIIRIFDPGYEHNQFLYDSAQFFNDQNRLLNFGIAELLAPMQAIMDWLMNSRVWNVRKVINNQLVVDSRYVDMNDLKERNAIIRTKGTPDGMSIDQYIKQLQVTDVTTGHITDMGVVKDFSQDATGLSDNLVGQYSAGRRSAREASNVNANAASRVILPVKGIWQSAILPLGRKLLKNHRQGLDIQQLVNIVGLSNVMSDPQAVQQFLPVDKSMLEGNYDFLVFDDTLPSQRTAIADILKEVGLGLLSNPRAVFALGIDPKPMFDEFLKLSGIRNVDRFRLTPQRFGELALMAGLGGNPAGAGAAQGQGPAGGTNGLGQSAGVPR